MSPDDAAYAVAFALPADWNGIKLMALPGLHHKRAHLEAPFAKVGDVESLTIFDDVFVPEERVFMNGLDNEGVCRYAGYLALMFAHYHRHSYTGCKTAVSEVIASQAALVADVNDIAKESHVREKICDIISTAELVFSAGVCLAYRAVKFPSGQYCHDEILTNAGAVSPVTTSTTNMSYSPILRAAYVHLFLPKNHSMHPETAALCNKYIVRNPEYSAEDTHRVMRMMETSCCDAFEVLRLLQACTAAVPLSWKRSS